MAFCFFCIHCKFENGLHHLRTCSQTHSDLHAYNELDRASWFIQCWVQHTLSITSLPGIAEFSLVHVFLPTWFMLVSHSLFPWISAQICAEWGLIGIVRQQRSPYLSLALSRSRDIEFRLGSEVKWGADETGLSSPSPSLTSQAAGCCRLTLFWGKYHIMKENRTALSPSPCSADHLFILHVGMGAQTEKDKIRFIKSFCKMWKCDRFGV